MHQVEHPTEVHIDRIGERLRRQTRRQRADAGVGDHDVEVAEFGDAPVDRGRQCRPVPDVGDRGDDALTLLLDETSGFVEVFRPGQWVLVGLDVLAEIHGDDVGALGGEHARVRTSLTTRGSTDYRDLACHPAHTRSLLIRSTTRPTLALKPFGTGAGVCIGRRGSDRGADPTHDWDRTGVQLHRFSFTTLRHCRTG